jgi:hypothetical protein
VDLALRLDECRPAGSASLGPHGLLAVSPFAGLAAYGALFGRRGCARWNGCKGVEAEIWIFSGEREARAGYEALAHEQALRNPAFLQATRDSVRGVESLTDGVSHIVLLRSESVVCVGRDPSGAMGPEQWRGWIEAGRDENSAGYAEDLQRAVSHDVGASTVGLPR